MAASMQPARTPPMLLAAQLVRLAPAPHGTPLESVRKAGEAPRGTLLRLRKAGLAMVSAIGMRLLGTQQRRQQLARDNSYTKIMDSPAQSMRATKVHGPSNGARVVGMQEKLMKDALSAAEVLAAGEGAVMQRAQVQHGAPGEDGPQPGVQVAVLQQTQQVQPEAQSQPDAPSRLDSVAASGGDKPWPDALRVKILNDLPSALLLDGVWVCGDSRATGDALEAAGVPGQGDADFALEGAGASLLVWFRTEQVPPTYVTLAVRRDEKSGGLRVGGEWGRALPADARTLLERAQPLEAGRPSLEAGGLAWSLLRDGGLAVKVLAESAFALVPVQQKDSGWLKLPGMPSLGEVTGSMLNMFKQRERNLEEQLAQCRVGQGEAPPVADRHLFSLLGLEPGASPREIREAWRRLAQELHPDVVGEETAEFDEVREAFQVLSDPTRRARYEALGMEESEDSGRLRGIACALALLQGAWALRPLLGGPLTLPLGLVAENGQDPGVEGRPKAESDPLADVRKAISSAMSVSLGLAGSPEDEAARTAAELRGAIAASKRVAPLAGGRDAETFEEALRLELKAMLKAADGTLAPHLLARWGSAQRSTASAWLKREAPRAKVASRQADDEEPSAALQWVQQASRIAGVAGASAASLTSLPGMVFSALLLPEDVSHARAEESVVRLMEVVHGASMLEVERRSRASALRLLDDKTRTWQERWRVAQALKQLGKIMEDEGEPGEADLVRLVTGRSEAARRAD